MSLLRNRSFGRQILAISKKRSSLKIEQIFPANAEGVHLKSTDQQSHFHAIKFRPKNEAVVKFCMRLAQILKNDKNLPFAVRKKVTTNLSN